MQPTPYVKTTNFAQDESANVGGRSTVRTDRVDAELENIELSLTETQENLELIQRDDGRLRDGLVELFNLSAACRAAFGTDIEPRGLWLTATAYVVGDLVDEASVSYLCAVAHTSGTFATDYAAGKWQVFGTNPTAAAITFTPPATMAATDVQAALVEVNAAARAASLPALSALYGAL
jgi:hypothetical protein